MPWKAPARLASARLVRPIARVTPARRATWGLGWHVRGGPRGHDAVRYVVGGGVDPPGGRPVCIEGPKLFAHQNLTLP